MNLLQRQKISSEIILGEKTAQPHFRTAGVQETWAADDALKGKTAFLHYAPRGNIVRGVFCFYPVSTDLLKEELYYCREGFGKFVKGNKMVSMPENDTVPSLNNMTVEHAYLR